MTATAQMGGHPVHWDEAQGLWLYTETGLVAPRPDMACRHCLRQPELVSVIVPADLSCTGEARPAVKPIDACIADLVRRLNAGATEPVTAACCCGHGEGEPEIILADGRQLVIRSADPADQ